MASRIKIRSGTRAALNAASSASQLIQFEPLFITDEQRFGVATAINAYATAGKEGEGGGGGIWVGQLAPVDPVAYPFWLNSDTFHLYVTTPDDGFVNVSTGYQGYLIWPDTTPPVDPHQSPFWWDLSTNVLKAYPNGVVGWQTIGPSAGGGGTTYEFALAGLGGF